MNPAIFKFDSSSSDDKNKINPCCEYLENNQEIDEPKIVSEIKETGQPYKEIEVIINNNKIALRIQKPRQIEEEDLSKQSEQKSRESQYTNFKKSSSYPIKNLNSKPERVIIPEKNEKNSTRPIDLVKNPNIFLLKIRKRSLNSDKKRENIDLEFRIPRPFKPKSIEKIKKRKIEIPLPVEIENTIQNNEIEIPLKKKIKK